MTTPIRSLRLYPNESHFLQQYSFNNGDLYYDSQQKTLVIFDGTIKGGIPLLKADLSNLAGGGGAGAGNINFGSSTVTAQAFIGDGSQLTNLPIPTNLATTTYVDNKFGTVATTSSLGTVKIGSGLSIAGDGTLSANALGDITSFANLTSLAFATGVAITSFSSDGTLTANSDSYVSTQKAVKTYVDTEIGALDLSASGVITTGTENRLAFYAASGITLSQTANTLRWDPDTDTLYTKNLTVATDVVVDGATELNGNLTVDADVTITGDVTAATLNTTEIFYDGTGLVKFSAGSDFVFDVVGEINAGGAKLTNIAAPVNGTDAVNKTYVDGAASAFSGGTVPNQTTFSAGQAASNTASGSVIITGGLGVSGNIYAGSDIYINGSAVLTSLSGGFNGGTLSGVVYINNGTVSGSISSGALRVAGGVGIAKTLNVGGDATFNGIRFGNGATAGNGYSQNVAVGGGTGINSPLGTNVSGVNLIAIGYSTLGQVFDVNDSIAIGNQVMANKTGGSANIGIGTDALIENQSYGNVAIGYLAGNALLTGDNNVILGGNSGSTINSTSNNVIISDGAGGVKLQFNSSSAMGVAGANYGDAGQVLTSQGNGAAPLWSAPSGFTGGTVSGAAIFTNNTASSTSGTGAVTLTQGGLGVFGNINAGGVIAGLSIQSTPIGSTTRSTGAFTTLAANAQVTFSAGIASGSTGAGTVVVTGGVGVSGALNVGSSLSAGGQATFTQNATANNTSSGSVVVTGGMGVSGTVYAAAFNGPLTGNVTGTVTGNAGTVTNGFYTTSSFNLGTTSIAVNRASATISLTGVNIDGSAGSATTATQFATVTQPTYSESLRANRNITGGGTITVSAGGSVLWGTRFIVITNGFGSNFSTAGYFDITCPVSGTVTGVGGHANVTATAAGITMAAWDALYYILPIGSTSTSLAANFRIATYTTTLDVPHTWVLIALRNGDDSIYYFNNGVRLKAGDTWIGATSTSNNAQMNSLGVGTAASGTAGEIRATNEITAYYTSDKNLKTNVVTIENALGKLRQVSGVMFDWTDEEIARRGGEDGYFVRKHDTGIIAQDVEAVLPEVVATREDGFKAVKYEKLAGLIIQAINELADQVDELKKKVG
jgi:hypothetical protein